jgi:hypothetical protein
MGELGYDRRRGGGEKRDWQSSEEDPFSLSPFLLSYRASGCPREVDCCLDRIREE